MNHIRDIALARNDSQSSSSGIDCFDREEILGGNHYLISDV